jgi:small subunit ribosomal protein S20
LAHSKQARKRVRVNQRKAQRNRVYRSAARTLVRRAVEAIESGDAEAAQLAVARAVRQLDKTASKGVIHKNNAARRKSRLMAKYNGMDAAA